jgi:hypothetical protein
MPSILIKRQKPGVGGGGTNFYYSEVSNMFDFNSISMLRLILLIFINI